MKTVKNNLLLIVSIALLLVLSAVGLVVLSINVQTVVTVVIGLLMVAGMLFLKEEHIHKSSLIIYVLVIGILLLKLILDNNVNYTSKLYIALFNPASLYTAAFLPLTYIQSAKMIGGYRNIKTLMFFVIIGVMILPIVLAFVQVNITPVIISSLVCYITLSVAKKEKRINVSWVVFLLLIVLAILTVAFIYLDSSYARIKLETIITRGHNEPLAAGWVRTNLDGIFTNTPFIGETNYFIGDDCPIAKMLSMWGKHNLVLILVKYGWLAFLLAILAYILFFVCVFKMVHETKQSSFAKYTSLMFALSLLIQAVYSLVGLFLLDRASIDMPFVSGNAAINVINYLSSGIVLSLYSKRNKTSVLNEEDSDKFIGRFHLLQAIGNYIYEPTNDE